MAKLTSVGMSAFRAEQTTRQGRSDICLGPESEAVRARRCVVHS